MSFNRRHQKHQATHVGLFVLTASTALVPAVPRECLDPKKTITQCVHEPWGAELGFPQMTITPITWSTEGQLWFATEEGLDQIKKEHGRVVVALQSELEGISNAQS